MKTNVGPTLPISEETHATKYRSRGETFRDAMNRVSNALKDDQPHYRALREILIDMRFMPAGRVQSAMGATKAVTPYNCFVSGTIEDSFTNGDGSIMQRATEAAETMRQGGGIGYDFSTLRPRGDVIKKLQSHSSGPVSFMQIFDSTCRCVASSGHRRGAQMGVMRIDHPDIVEFITAKHDRTSLTGFNMSVAVTNAFMDALRDGTPFALKFNGETYREIDPADLWDTLMRSTWDWAEPGVLFIDTINRMNNLWYCETIAATNPCGEQPLPPYGACLLGSFNLVKYLGKNEMGAWTFDRAQLREDIKPVVRAMDNVVDRADYPLPEQGREARAKRRMGLGVSGVANAFEAMGLSYGTPEYCAKQDNILSIIRDEAYQASVELAREKGIFALFDRDLYGKGEFIQTLPEVLQADIRKYGIRNSHLTSIAPTGTISLCADNISSGIEPVFAHSFSRTVIEAAGPRTETIEDYGSRVLGVKGKTTAEVTIEEHLNVLISAAKHVDSAVSKTCNVSGDVPWEDFKNLYVKAYEGGAKGCTTFRVDGKRAGILVASEEKKDETEEGGACVYDPNTGRRTCE